MRSGNSVYLGEDGILRVMCIGDQDEASARDTVEQVMATAKTAPGEVDLLFDASRAGRFSAEARKVIVRSVASVAQGRAAFVGSSTLMRALGLFTTGGASARRMRFFETRREALSWLGERYGREADKRRGIRLQSVWRSITRVRWLRIKEPWLKEVFEVMEAVAVGDFSKRITVSQHEDELALIEAGINLLADDLEERDREASEHSMKLREERNRLARELHDSVSQLLFSVALNSEVAGTLVESDPELAKARMKSVQAVARTAHQQMRDLLTELRLGPLEAGLSAALSEYVTMFKEREGIDTTFSVEGERPLSPAVERELFRIAQEALNNVGKHSQATSVRVELGFSPGFVCLTVEDNGIGFDLERPKAGSLGLTSMRERAERLGGQLAIESAQGEGARVTIELPREEGYG
jgi:NarL family two-component system sensor histidine kinase LiaS